jgi:hypothetical protein
MICTSRLPARLKPRVSLHTSKHKVVKQSDAVLCSSGWSLEVV